MTWAHRGMAERMGTKRTPGHQEAAGKFKVFPASGETGMCEIEGVGNRLV